MDKFIIYLIDNKISIEMFEETTTILKKEGESVFDFSDDFWEWFKEKIDYNQEELSFIIVSDKEIKIPDDIKIAKVSAFQKAPILKIYKNTKVYTIPKIEKKSKTIIKEKELTLLDFFIKKTEEIKNL